MENFNDVEQNSIDNNTAVIVCVESLREINEQAVKCGYNRAFDWELAEAELRKFFNELNDKMEHKLDIERLMFKFSVVLVPLMEHQHKRGVPCEKHMRCLVKFGKTPHPILDVPMNTWRRLCKTRDLRKRDRESRNAVLCCDYRGWVELPTPHNIAA